MDELTPLKMINMVEEMPTPILVFVKTLKPQIDKSTELRQKKIH
jgi:hypothetical protein